MLFRSRPAQVAGASTSAVISAVEAVASTVPVAESRSTTPAEAKGSAAAATPSAPAAGGEATYRDVQGGSRSTLFGSKDSAPGHSGGSRQTIIHRPDGAQEGGLLTGTPVGATLDSVLVQVSDAVPVPLPVEATVSVPGITGPLETPLSAVLQLPEGQSVAVQVPPALSSALGGLLQPVTGALNGLTAGH